MVWTDDAGTQLVGANTTAFVVELAPGTRVVGARRRPGCGSLLGVAGEGVRDARVRPDEVWASEGERLSGGRVTVDRDRGVDGQDGHFLQDRRLRRRDHPQL
ncbi:MAG: hypothetical protein ACR2OB_07450 [Solirubrobacteraceae bacterium]